MNRKIGIAAIAALALAASSAPALAQWGGQGFSFGVGFGGGWNSGYYGDYGYYRRPGVGVSVGFGSPGWGADDWNYGSYAAAPSGCTCASRYRTVRAAPRYAYSSYAYGGYPSDYNYYDDNYYGGSYASVGFGWNDDGWRNRRLRRDYDRRSVRFDRGDRVRTDVSIGDRERRGNRITRTAGAEARVRGNGEFRSGAGGEIRSGGNAGGSAMRMGSNGGATTVKMGNNGGRRGDGTR